MKIAPIIEAGRQQPAMAGADQKPRGMRNDQPDEADRADDADHGRRHHRGRAKQHDAHARDRDAERRRGIDAEGEGIERAGMKHADGKADQARRARPDRRPASARRRNCRAARTSRRAPARRWPTW